MFRDAEIKFWDWSIVIYVQCWRTPPNFESFRYRLCSFLRHFSSFVHSMRAKRRLYIKEGRRGVRPNFGLVTWYYHLSSLMVCASFVLENASHFISLKNHSSPKLIHRQLTFYLKIWKEFLGWPFVLCSCSVVHGCPRLYFRPLGLSWGFSLERAEVTQR